MSLYSTSTSLYRYSIRNQSYGDGDIATRAGLTSWKHVAMDLHIWRLKAYLNIACCNNNKGSCTLGGAFCDWAAFWGQHCSPIFWEGTRKGVLNNAALTKLVSSLWLTAVQTSRNKKYYAKRHPLQICCWNVRTLIDNDNRIERKTAILASELLRYNVDIAAISETRFAGEDQLIEPTAGYTIFWSGKSEE